MIALTRVLRHKNAVRFSLHSRVVSFLIFHMAVNANGIIGAT